jgi:hypothetical protein
MAEQSWQDAASEVWQLFKETDAKFKETDAKFKETQTELERRFKETDAKFKETDAQFKETDAKIAALTENINRLEGQFGNQWGRLIEALVKPSVVAIMKERGIKIDFVDERISRSHNGDSIELDLILTNTDTLVIIETKSHLKTDNVRQFIEKLGYFFAFFPHYRGYKVYAGVAGLTIPGEVGRFAYRQGLFVLQVGSDGMVTLKNDVNFKPKDFGEPAS